MSHTANLLDWVTEALSGGHWVTVHGGSGGHGVHVYISDGAGGGAGHAAKGAILAGPKGLVGANIGHLSHLGSHTHHHAGQAPSGATSQPTYSAAPAKPKSRVEAGEAFHKATGGITGTTPGPDYGQDNVGAFKKKNELIDTYQNETDPEKRRTIADQIANIYASLGNQKESDDWRQAALAQTPSKPTRAVRLNRDVVDFFKGVPPDIRDSVVVKSLIQGLSDEANREGGAGGLARMNGVTGFILGAVESKMSDANQAELAKRILAIDLVDDTTFDINAIMAGRSSMIADPAGVAALGDWYTGVSAPGAEKLRATYDPNATNGKQEQQKWLQRPLATISFTATKELPYGAKPARTARLSKMLNGTLPEAERTLLNANGLHVEVYDGSDEEVDGGQSVNGATGDVSSAQAYFNPEKKVIKTFGMPPDAPDLMGEDPELQGDMRKSDATLTHEYDQYVLEHETGHALDDAMARARGLKDGTLIGIAQFGKVTLPFYGVSSLPEWKALFHKYEDNDYIRSYARSSTTEFFAEMHAMYTDPRTRQMQKDHYKDIYDYMANIQQEYTSYVDAARKGGDHAA